jgi:hypothetical protein
MPLTHLKLYENSIFGLDCQKFDVSQVGVALEKAHYLKPTNTTALGISVCPF